MATLEAPLESLRERAQCGMRRQLLGRLYDLDCRDPVEGALLRELEKLVEPAARIGYELTPKARTG